MQKLWTEQKNIMNTKYLTILIFLVFVSCNQQNKIIKYYKPVNKVHWRAIIAFTNTDKVSEDWNWFYGDITDACLNKGIYVAHAEVNDNYVDVGPLGKPILQINISKYTMEYTSGYLFLEKGRKIQYFKYDLSNETLRKASKYFKLDLTGSENK
jgi:hypothetical protein